MHAVAVSASLTVCLVHISSNTNTKAIGYMSVTHCIGSFSLTRCLSHTQSLSLTLVLAYTSFSSVSFWHWWEFRRTTLCLIHSVRSPSLPASLYHLICYITALLCSGLSSLPSRRSSNPYGLARNMSHFLGYTSHAFIGRSMRIFL